MGIRPGNTTAFEYGNRHETFAALVRNTLRRLSLCQTPNIVFHYAEKLSREDRDTILRAARELYPEGTYTFVWVNSHHNVRFFDTRAETDGSLSRGSYVLAAPNQMYLSTTGYNPFRRALGTPKPLEVSRWVHRPDGVPATGPDMRAVAVQLLSLTKLNWASTDSFCGEPITLKYAGDIAYLTAAFLRQAEPFRLHPHPRVDAVVPVMDTWSGVDTGTILAGVLASHSEMNSVRCNHRYAMGSVWMWLWP